MACTPLLLGVLDIEDGTTYRVDHATRLALEAQAPVAPRSLGLANNAPLYVGPQYQGRDLPINILLKPASRTARIAAAQAVMSAIRTDGLTKLSWVELGIYYLVYPTDSARADHDYHRLSLALRAPDPLPRSL